MPMTGMQPRPGIRWRSLQRHHRLNTNDSEYIELHAASAFSFLAGASQPEALSRRAVELEMPAIALADRNGLYGAARFHTAAQPCRNQGAHRRGDCRVSIRQPAHAARVAAASIYR